MNKFELIDQLSIDDVYDPYATDINNDDFYIDMEDSDEVANLRAVLGNIKDIELRAVAIDDDCLYPMLLLTDNEGNECRWQGPCVGMLTLMKLSIVKKPDDFIREITEFFVDWIDDISC